MALPTPPLPGIPPLLNKAAVATNVVALVVADIAFAKSLFNRPKWGIYKDGVLAIAADAVASVEYKQDFRIADYPMESGAFESYNKVATPYDARVRLTKGGSTTDRAAFLAAIEAAVASLDLYQVVTPERTYLSANVQSMDYRRQTNHGVGLLTVEIRLVEVRITVAAKFSNTVQPSSADAVNVGTVQAGQATAGQATAPLAAAAKGP